MPGFMLDVGTSSANRPHLIDIKHLSVPPCRLNRGGIPKITLMVSGQPSRRFALFKLSRVGGVERGVEIESGEGLLEFQVAGVCDD